MQRMRSEIVVLSFNKKKAEYEFEKPGIVYEKVTLTIFWNTNSVDWNIIWKSGATDTNVGHSEMSDHQVKPAIRTERRDLLSKQVFLMHSNGRSHTAAHTIERKK